MNSVYIGIGSNVEPRKQNCDHAIDIVRNSPAIVLTKVSNFYESSPVAPAKENDNCFINCVMFVETELSSIDTLKFCEEIEKKLGRKEKGNGNPRTIDLDILLFNDEVINTDELTVPHPRLHERLFVLKPLDDIASDVTHPVLGLKINEILKKRDNKGGSNEIFHRYS